MASKIVCHKLAVATLNISVPFAIKLALKLKVSSDFKVILFILYVEVEFLLMSHKYAIVTMYISTVYVIGEMRGITVSVE